MDLAGMISGMINEPMEAARVKGTKKARDSMLKLNPSLKDVIDDPDALLKQAQVWDRLASSYTGTAAADFSRKANAARIALKELHGVTPEAE